MPDTSIPGVNGGFGAPGYKPIRERISAKFIPAFETRIHTSPGPGDGLGSSCISKLSGPPCFVTITAFINPHHSSNLGQDV